MTASRRVPGVVEEDDAEIGSVIVRRDDVTAVHVGMATRLEDDQPAHRVEVLEREAAPLEDRGALERRHTAGEDAKRLPTRVVVGRLDPHAQVSLKVGYRLVSRRR